MNRTHKGFNFKREGVQTDTFDWLRSRDIVYNCATNLFSRLFKLCRGLIVYSLLMH